MITETRFEDIPEGTTVIFTDTLLLGGIAPDITGDTLTITIKADKEDPDPGVLQVVADVAIQGAGGIGVFELTPTHTAIEPGDYFYEIMWVRSNARKYRPHFGNVRITKRVSNL